MPMPHNGPRGSPWTDRRKTLIRECSKAAAAVESFDTSTV
jgi:hypothetical protein